MVDEPQNNPESAQPRGEVRSFQVPTISAHHLTREQIRYELALRNIEVDPNSVLTEVGHGGWTRTTPVVTNTTQRTNLFPEYDGHTLYRQSHTQPTLTANTQPISSSVWNAPTYHPATTPRREVPETNTFPPNPIMTSFHDSRSSERTPTDSKQFYQEQQTLRKWLGYRLFEGIKFNSKFLQLEEFIRVIKHFHVSSGTTDEAILRNLSTSFTGAAFLWWDVNHTQITSLGQLERLLRERFARQTIDPMALIAEVTSRKQQRGEDLLTFMDNMRQMMLRSPNLFSEQQQIEMIINNASSEYSRILVSRTYGSVSELQHHASYLERHFSKSNRTEIRSDARRTKQVAAIANETDSGEDEMGDKDGEDENDSETMHQLVHALKQVQKKWNKPLGKKPTKPDFVPSKGSPVPPTDESKNTLQQKHHYSKDYQGICTNCYTWGHKSYDCTAPKSNNCFGCGKPNTFMSDCDNCKNRAKPSIPSKNQ